MRRSSVNIEGCFIALKTKGSLNSTRMPRITDYSRVKVKKIYLPIPSLGAMVSVLRMTQIKQFLADKNKYRCDI